MKVAIVSPEGGPMHLNLWVRFANSEDSNQSLTLLHSEQPKLHKVLAILSTIGLSPALVFIVSENSKGSDQTAWMYRLVLALLFSCHNHFACGSS